MNGGPSGLLAQVLASPVVAKFARAGAQWLDFEKTGIIASLKRLAPQTRGRLLDVGCGDKPYEEIFRPYVSSYTGIENEETFQATQASRRGVGPDVTYLGDRLPFDDKSFDTVVSIQVLEHTPRPAELIAEMARVLADDGVLILSVPFSYRLHEEPHDYFRYTPHGLRELCGRAGLGVDQVLPRGGLWTLVGHQLNTFLAFRVARMGAFAQSIGGLGHEAPASVRLRAWTLPVVGPAMACVGVGARLMDRYFSDPSDTLGFVVTARRG